MTTHTGAKIETLEATFVMSDSVTIDQLEAAVKAAAERVFSNCGLSASHNPAGPNRRTAFYIETKEFNFLVGSTEADRHIALHDEVAMISVSLEYRPGQVERRSTSVMFSFASIIDEIQKELSRIRA